MEKKSIAGVQIIGQVLYYLLIRTRYTVDNLTFSSMTSKLYTGASLKQMQ
jgi:hypothetical protein